MKLVMEVCLSTLFDHCTHYLITAHILTMLVYLHVHVGVKNKERMLYGNISTTHRPNS